MTGRNPDGTEDFPLPDCPTSPTARSGCTYEDFLDRVRGTDDLRFHLKLELTAARNPTSAQTSEPRRTG